MALGLGGLANFRMTYHALVDEVSDPEGTNSLSTSGKITVLGSSAEKGGAGADPLEHKITCFISDVI